MSRYWATLLGWHGAGKTTVGQTLEAEPPADLGPVVYISGSRLLDLYVEAERTDLEHWESVRERKNRGEPADPELTHALLRERVALLPEDVTVLLDGFPKSHREVGLTRATLPSPGIELAVLLECDPLTRTGRIRSRLVCPACGAVTSSFAQIGADPACPRRCCGARLARRPDDHPDVSTFRDSGEPPDRLAKPFAQDGRLAKIDATVKVGEVVAAVAVALSRQRREDSARNRS